MEQDAAVIALKRTGISIPQRKRQAHRLAAVIMLKRTGIFVPQRKLSCKQAFSSCERGCTYRLGVNYSTFVPLLVYQMLSMYKYNNLWPTDANTSRPAQFYTTDDYFKRPCFKQNLLFTRTIQPQRLRESIIRGKRTGVQHAQPSKEAY
jgi:hypothetical protein